MDQLNLSRLLSVLQELLATWGLKIVGALAILIVGRIVAGWIRKLARKAFGAAHLDETLVPFLANLLYFGLIAFVVISALQVAGVPTTSAVAVVGAAGLAVGLAFQGTLSNFSAGVMLLTFRPFHVGDFVDAGGVSGTVKEIGVFASTLATPDNVRITVPNSKISGEVIKNYSRNETRRVDMVMGVSYDDDLNLAIRTIREVLAAEGRILEEPAPVVAVDNLGASSVDILVRPWVASTDYWAVKWDLTKALKEELEAAGCSIPYPQRDVHLFTEAAQEPLQRAAV